MAQQKRVNVLNGSAQPKKNLAPKAKAGQNSKGSQKKPIGTSWKPGSKGFFNYGLGQYGYINPAGTINWKADAKKATAGAMLGFGSISPHAKKTDQLKNMPAQKNGPGSYMVPGAQMDVANSRYAANRSLEDATYQNDVAEADYHQALNALSEAFGGIIPGATSNLAARGIDPSEGAGAGSINLIIDDHDRQANEMKRQRDKQVFDLGRFEKNTQKDLDSTILGIESKAKDAWLADPTHKGKLVTGKTGFWKDKKSGQVFYTNPKTGVTVSASQSKLKNKKKGRR